MLLGVFSIYDVCKKKLLNIVLSKIEAIILKCVVDQAITILNTFKPIRPRQEPRQAGGLLGQTFTLTKQKKLTKLLFRKHSGVSTFVFTNFVRKLKRRPKEK